jgi:hypothetical protein
MYTHQIYYDVNHSAYSTAILAILAYVKQEKWLLMFGFGPLHNHDGAVSMMSTIVTDTA